MRKHLLFLLWVCTSALYAESLNYAFVDSLINNAIYPVGYENRVGDSVFQNDTRCIPGAVLCVVDSGRITYLRAYGNRAVVPACEPMTTNTVFDLASLSKPLGAGSAALLLIERGRLSADDKVSTYIPAFQTDATIHHLLTHRSGLPPYMNARVLDSIYTARNIVQLSRQDFLIDTICRCRRLSPVGEKYCYSCLNFITLQRVVETVVGTDINTFLAANLYTLLHTDAMGWLPSDTLLPRIAPTECNDTACLRGIVHDPLARVMMQGISGNAGLFATAEDVAKWAIWFMSLPDSTRTVACNAGLWANADNGTLSHTGYTGTSIVLYPDCGRAIILLTNRVHPTDTGSLASLRRALTACGECPVQSSNKQTERVIVGVERMNAYLPLLQGKRVALLSNHTGMVGDTHTLDHLLAHGVQVTAVFSPEHGFRGTAREGEHVQSSVDEKTGIPILSLYDGKTYRPSAESMSLFDVLIADIQDVGLRFYTYYITMMRLMDACAHSGKQFVVFDRPNPNGYYIDGPLLDMRYKSGVGALPIPVVHGMTLGELARMINGEYWLSDSLQVDLTVITCLNYTHQTIYNLPVPPSPNLRNMLAVYLYPSVCLFEGTPVSLGRGTDKPFLCYGHPDYHATTDTDTISFTPTASTQKGNLCHGIDLSGMSESDARNVHFSLRYLIDTYNVVRANADTANGKAWDGDAFFTPFFEKLVGVDYIRHDIIAGHTEEEIRARWQPDIQHFEKQRKPYLLYEE